MINEEKNNINEEVEKDNINKEVKKRKKKQIDPRWKKEKKRMKKIKKRQEEERKKQLEKEFKKDLRTETKLKLHDKEVRRAVKADSEVLLKEGRSLREVCRILSRKYEIKHSLLRNFLSGKTFKEEKLSKFEEKKKKYKKFIGYLKFQKKKSYKEIAKIIEEKYGEKLSAQEVCDICYNKKKGKKAEFDKDKAFEYDSDKKKENLWTIDHKRDAETLTSKKLFENPEVKKAIIEEVDKRLDEGEFLSHICADIASRYDRKWKCIERLYKGQTYKKEFASEIKEDVEKIKANIESFNQMLKEKRSYAYIAEKLGLTSSHYSDAIYYIEKFGDLKIDYKIKDPKTKS